MYRFSFRYDFRCIVIAWPPLCRLLLTVGSLYFEFCVCAFSSFLRNTLVSFSSKVFLLVSYSSLSLSAPLYSVLCSLIKLFLARLNCTDFRKNDHRSIIDVFKCSFNQICCSLNHFGFDLSIDNAI